MKNLIKSLFVAIVAMSVTFAFAQNNGTTEKKSTKMEKTTKKDGKTTKTTKTTKKAKKETKTTTPTPAAK